MSFVLVKNSAKTITTLTNVFFGSVPRPPKLKSRRIKNAKKITYSQWKSFAFQTIGFFSNLTCLILTIIYTQITQIISTQQQKLHISDSLLISSICSCIFHIMSYINDIKVQLLTLQEQKQITFIDIGYGILKSIFLLVHPSNYFIDITFDSSHQDIEHTQHNGYIFNNLNKLLTTICYFKIIYIYGYLSKNNRYYGTRISRLLSVYGHRNKVTNIMYAIKCLFKQEGMLSNLFLLMFATGFLALIGILVSKQTDLITYVYICLQTMSTVGYGEFRLEQSLERMVLILVIISGSFAGSAFTIYLLQFLQLQDKQSKAYRLIKRLEYQDRITIQKMNIVKQFLKKKKNKNNNNSNNQIQNKILDQKSLKLTNISINKWKLYQKELQVDKSPILQFVTIKYTYFCNSLKTLIERQVLSYNLLQFYIQRMDDYQLMLEKKYHKQCLEKMSGEKIGSGIRPNSIRRVQDSTKLYVLKEKILGYRK